MLDKNGVEIKTGDVVEIRGAYFKNDNGFWYVENSAGDPNWTGKDYSLRKISKTGKISKASRNICFWPIMIVTNNWAKRAEAKAWNQEHATIEVKKDIDRKEIANHFIEQAEEMDDQIRYSEYNFGSQETERLKAIQSHYQKVAADILAEV